MRYAARTDNTQRAIVDALREVGCDVLLLFRVGSGCPDLLCWSPYTQRLTLIECKTRNGPLTPDEQEWIAGWGGPVSVVRSVEEALAAVGVAVATQDDLKDISGGASRAGDRGVRATPSAHRD